MNYVDLILLLVIGLSVLAGYRRGLVLGLLELVSWLGSLVLAFMTYTYPANWLMGFWPSLGYWATPLGFLLAFILFRLLFSWLTGMVLVATGPRLHTHPANRFLGMAPGLLNGLIWAVLMVLMLQTLPLGQDVADKTSESRLARRFDGAALWLERRLSPAMDSVVHRSMRGLTIEPESSRSIPLQFSVQDARPRPELEARMLELVNEERRKHGLKELKADTELREVARKHSADMLARSYFSHLSPEGSTPFERMRREGVRFMIAGENLALARNVQMAHTGLMQSPGHRANILRPEFGRLGIGILDGGIHGIMVTQNFRN
jgi:uncharacterized protein YkwD